MLEIILMIYLGRKIAKMAARKGESRARWVITFILMWIMGEFLGISFVFSVFGPSQDMGFLLLSVLFGIGVALLLYLLLVKRPLERLPDMEQ